MESVETHFSRHPQVSPEIINTLLKTFHNGVVALDLEMTGLSPAIDQIIEISAIKVTPLGVDTFSTLVNPKINISEESTAIHGITNLMVMNAPTIDEVLPKFFEFISNLPIIGHNVKYDTAFIASSAYKSNLHLPSNDVYCSYVFSKAVIKDAKTHGLQHLIEFLNIPVSTHHRALADSISSLIVFEKCLEKSDNIEKAKLFKLSDYNSDNDFDIPENLHGIVEKIKLHHLIFIKYRGGSKKNTFRPIMPTAFLPMPGGNTLYALCLESGMYKSYTVKKITEWKEMNASELAIWTKEKMKY